MLRKVNLISLLLRKKKKSTYVGNLKENKEIAIYDM